MTRPRPSVRLLMALVVCATAVVATALVATSEDAPATPSAVSTAAAPDGITDMTVVGDSISALYNDRPGDAMQGWWSIVGRHLGVPVDRYAQSGSGYLKRGRGCTGTTFAQRPAALASAPSLLVLEGGRNDWSTCRGGRSVPATDTQVRTAVAAYLDLVLASVPETTRVIVLGPPWGTVGREHRDRVTAIIRAEALARELEFVDLRDALGANTVYDGIHPNLAGSRRIAQRIIAALEAEPA